MSTNDLFEQRAASAGAALRTAFLEETSMDNQTLPRLSTAAPTTPRAPRSSQWGSRHRWLVPGAAALAAAAAVAGVFALAGSTGGSSDDSLPPAGREEAEITKPYLVGSGTVPEAGRYSVQNAPVPFSVDVPAPEPGSGRWFYRTAPDLFDIGLQQNGVIVFAPTETYDPGRTWKGQTTLVPAPTDRAGWEQWLEQTGQVDVVERETLEIGGAPATRLSIDLRDLPASYDGCGGGRTCLAIMPMLDPEVGAARAGTGAQIGIEDLNVELTVIELEDRAVLVLTGGDSTTADQWLPTMHQLVESLRFS